MVLLDGFLAVFLFTTLQWGSWYAKDKNRKDFLEQHEWSVKMLGWTMFATVIDVLFAEVFLFREPRTSLNKLHEIIATTFLLFFCLIKFWLDGKRFPKIHGRLVYLCLALGFMTAAFGGYRLYHIIDAKQIPFP